MGEIEVRFPLSEYIFRSRPLIKVFAENFDEGNLGTLFRRGLFVPFTLEILLATQFLLFELSWQCKQTRTMKRVLAGDARALSAQAEFCGIAVTMSND